MAFDRYLRQQSPLYTRDQQEGERKRLFARHSSSSTTKESCFSLSVIRNMLSSRNHRTSVSSTIVCITPKNVLHCFDGGSPFGIVRHFLRTDTRKQSFTRIFVKYYPTLTASRTIYILVLKEMKSIYFLRTTSTNLILRRSKGRHWQRVTEYRGVRFPH